MCSGRHYYIRRTKGHTLSQKKENKQTNGADRSRQAVMTDGPRQTAGKCNARLMLTQTCLSSSIKHKAHRTAVCVYVCVCVCVRVCVCVSVHVHVHC